MANKEVNIIIKATDEATKTFSKVGKASLAFAGAIGVMAVNSAIKFEKQMGNVATLLDGDVQKSIGNLSNGIQDMLREMPVDGDELGLAAYDAVSAGFSETADTLLVLREASRLSVAGLGTVAEATDLTTSALNAFNMGAEQSAEATNILFETVKAGKTTVSELSVAFGNVAPSANAAGVSFIELSAATAAMTTTGMKTSVVQNNLKSLFTELNREGTKLAGAFDSIGVSNVKAAVEAEGFVPLLNRLKTELNLTDVEFQNLIGSQEAQTAALSLLGAQSESFEGTMANMTDGVNSITTAFDRQKQATWAQTQMLKNNLNVALVNLGTVVLPALNTSLEWTNSRMNLIVEGLEDVGSAGGIGAQGVMRMTTVMSELDIAIARSTGAEKEFLEQTKETAERGKSAWNSFAQGHDHAGGTMLDVEKKMKLSMADLAKSSGVDAKKMAKAMEGLSNDTSAYIGEIDSEFAREVMLSGTRAKDMTENYADGVEEGLPSVEGAVGNVISAISALDDSDSSTWGIHLIGNLASGMMDNMPAVNSAVNATMSIIRRLQHSTNEELPEELWGQHASENFGTGWVTGNQKVRYAVGETVTILNAFGQEVDVVIGDVSGYWDAYTTQLDDTNQSQKDMFSDGIAGIAEMQKEYESEVSKIKSTISGLEESLTSILGESSEKQAANRNKLANAIVDSEERMAGIKEQIQDESDWVRRKQLQDQFDAEQATMEANKELINQMETEVTEIKRFNNLSRLGQSVETYHKEEQAIAVWTDAAVAAWKEQYDEAQASLEGIQELWGIRTEALKEYMGEEIDKNGDLKSAVEDSIDEVKELIRQLKDLDKQQSSMGMSSGGGGSIPRMAKGGIVNSPTLALIGEDGPEAVVPLNRKNNPMYGEGGGGIQINITGTFLSEDVAEQLGDKIVDKLSNSTRF